MTRGRIGLAPHRDVRVAPQEPPPPDETAAKPPSPGTVTVFGWGKDDVLFSSDQARTVQWRDADGEVVALLVSLKPGVWGFSKSGDPDWEQVLALHGSQDR